MILTFSKPVIGPLVYEIIVNILNCSQTLRLEMGLEARTDLVNEKCDGFKFQIEGSTCRLQYYSGPVLSFYGGRARSFKFSAYVFKED